MEVKLVCGVVETASIGKNRPGSGATKGVTKGAPRKVTDCSSALDNHSLGFA